MMSSRLTLVSEVQYVKGVGPARAALLAERGIRTVEDLLGYTPFRYEDRTRLARIRGVLPGEMATVFARVLTAELARTRRGMYIYEVSAADAQEPGKGGIIYCKWFNALYLERSKTFRPGQRVFFYGKIERDPFARERLQMIQPQFEILPEEEAAGGASLEVGRIVPIYESVGTLGPRAIRRLIAATLDALDAALPDPLPASVRARNRLPARAAALRHAHFPDDTAPIEQIAQFRAPAQVRLIFEEFFDLGARLALKRRKLKAAQGIPLAITPTVREQIKKILPFHPTAAQKRVLREIADDLGAPRPMNRLLQGDVGSGKTIVAVQAALIALANGHQVALMAPTEILATQHALYIQRLLAPLPYSVELLISGRRAAEKRALKERLAQGAAQFMVGTHALLEPDVQFRSLGLVIVDEQHRFGVMQRYALIRKGPAPHVLVMTATPIPRTLALTLYGELDCSVIDELPPHRPPIETRLMGEDGRERALEFIRAKVRAGEQAYVVYPVIEESKLELRAAVRMYEHLAKNVFTEFRVGLLHGRLESAEKEDVMQRFRQGEIQVLVSTTVVEVGVDVPNATVMLIEHAERFGLAQLHQLRGRIGRGGKKSTCLLLAASDAAAGPAAERLRTLAETTDGFKIAEVDLKLRGPGEFFGTRQWGIPAFRIANLLRDQEILEWARREASDFVEHPPSDAEFKSYVDYLHSEWPRKHKLAGVA